MSQPHRRPVPAHVTDVLLWLLATDVAAQHLPNPGRPATAPTRAATRRRTRARQRATPSAPAAPPPDPRRSPLAYGPARVIASAAAATGSGWLLPARPSLANPPQEMLPTRAA